MCITYEGTNKVKNSILKVLLQDYELFTMWPHESFFNIFKHFIRIITSLHVLGHTIANVEKVNKNLHYFES